MNNYDLRIINIIETRGCLLMSNPNVRGIAYGYKEINKHTTNLPSLIFFVKKKLSKSAINAYNYIPNNINGALTDVVETGEFNFCNGPKGEIPRQASPILPGYSIQNPANKNGGIVTCAVSKGPKFEFIYILTAGHVVRSEIPGKSYAIVQPKLTQEEIDNGKTSRPYVGNVDYVSKIITVEKSQKIALSSQFNPYDIALVKVGPNNTETKKKILSYEFWNGSVIEEFASNVNIKEEVTMNIENHFSRKVTGGEVSYTKMCFRIEGEKNDTIFSNQIGLWNHDTRKGDSGVMILKNTSNDYKRPYYIAIGLLMGAVRKDQETITVVSPIYPIIKENNIAILNS